LASCGMGHLALKVLLTLFMIGDGGQAPSKRRRDPAPLTVYGRMYYLFAVALWRKQWANRQHGLS
jgi:hypothetical protein